MVFLKENAENFPNLVKFIKELQSKKTYEILSKLIKKDLTTKEAMIDPKNPTNVGSSYWNLGNHTLAICFILCLAFVVYASYK